MPHLSAVARSIPSFGKTERSFRLFFILVAICFLSLLTSPQTCLAASKQDADLVADLVTALKQAEHVKDDPGGARRQAQIRRIYSASFLPKLDDSKRRQLSDDDARLVYEAANMAAFYTLDAKFAHDQVDALKELERRRIATPLQAKDTLKSLIAVRDFTVAQRFSSSHPNTALPSLPTFVPSDDKAQRGGSELLVSADGRMLTQRSSPAGTSAQILVVSHPLCHFTQNAVRDIEADPALSKLFSEHSKWLAPQGRDVDFSIFSTWNSQHPTLPMTIAYQQSDWPMLTDWDTPVFYFIRDGQVVSTVAGWPRNGRKNELRSAARQIGLEIAAP